MKIVPFCRSHRESKSDLHFETWGRDTNKKSSLLYNEPHMMTIFENVDICFFF